MLPIKEVDQILSSIFSAPFGSFPKGGVLLSFRLTKSSFPSFILLSSERKEWGKLKIGKENYIVEHSPLLSSTKSEHTELREAIISLLTPFLHEEINYKVK